MTDTSSYKGETPASLPLDPRIPAFFTNFYAVSDDPSSEAHRAYAGALTRTATLVMGSRTVSGYDDIYQLRVSLWSGPVVKRKHTLYKIFPFGKDSNEVMLYGKVEYALKNGKDVTVDWAGRALMVEEEGELKMSLYQVYLDSAVVANAMKD